MLERNDLQARVRRLEQLTVGLAKEVSLFRAAGDPMLRLERLAYLEGIQDALAGADKARVALACALMRMRDDDQVRPTLVVVRQDRGEDAA